jgi:very-short-patch-repair endonuclease
MRVTGSRARSCVFTQVAPTTVACVFYGNFWLVLSSREVAAGPRELMPETVRTDRAARRYSTQAERRFWALLYPWRMSGWHFRRQTRIGPFTADVVCQRIKVIFDIVGDGYGHDLSSKPEERQAHLSARGYRIMRIHHREIRSAPETVIERLSYVFGTRWTEDLGSLMRRIREIERME